jgi:outer membrane protein
MTVKLFFHTLFLVALLAIGTPPCSAETLVDIYKLALNNDATLKQAEATYRATVEIETLSSSTLLPSIEGNGSYSENDSGVSDTTTSKGYSLSLSQKLFDLPAWFSYKRGKQVSKQAQAQLAYDQQDLIIRVATAYFDVLRARDNLKTSKAQEQANQRQLERTQRRYDVGLIPIADVHEAKARYDSTLVNRLTDEGALASSYEALTILTGQTHVRLHLLRKDFPIVKPNPVALDEWVQFALKQNQSLKAAHYGMDAAKLAAASSKMGHLPTVTANIQINDQKTSSPDRYNTNDNVRNGSLNARTDSKTISINLSVPIYSGGRISSLQRQAKELYNIALQEKIKVERTIVRDTRTSHIDTTTHVARVKARSQAIVSTRSALMGTQEGYEVGNRNITDVLNAQSSLYQSISDYANARYDYVLSMLKLKQAAGMLSPADVYDINKWLRSAQD